MSAIKALFRRAKALIEMNMLHEAVRDFQTALRLKPDDKAIEKELDKTREIILQELTLPTTDTPIIPPTISQSTSSKSFSDDIDVGSMTGDNDDASNLVV